MRPFRLEQAAEPQAAAQRFAAASGGPEAASVAYLAGGTTLVDLLKLEALRPDLLIDLSPLRGRLGGIDVGEDSLRLGALTTMAEVADHPDVRRHAPAVVDALRQAASGQLRNMATIGGNLLQRTRCPYFRDRHSACNKRDPGAGCDAIGGDARGLAVLGTSPHCIANYAGDLAVALVALEAEVRLLAPSGEERPLPVEELHRLPGDRPDLETTLRPGELITALVVPRRAWTASLYRKERDRASYAFALTSAAVAVELDAEGRVQDVRIVLGGLAAKPWRCRDAEARLVGRLLDEASAWATADACLEAAEADAARAYKIELGRRTVVRALLEARQLAQAGRLAAATESSTRSHLR